MDAESTLLEYYDALRAGEPLHPYFVEEEGALKFGISERLDGYEEIEDGLREQTETTDDWTVESRNRVVTERERTAWFGDDVRMAWTTADGDRHDFDTRWSGCLERREDGSRSPSGDGDDADAGWRFVSMHVSIAREL